jgi:hypothetical protein
MITIPMSTPSAMSPAVTTKSELPPLAAGWADALAVALAMATAERVGEGAVLADAAIVGAAVRDGLALAVAPDVAVAAAVGVALAATVGAGEAVVLPLVPSDAQARESLTPGAAAQTDRAGVTHELPSAAVRESDTRMKG